MSRLVIQNARIWTGDRSRPWAETLSIEAGRVAELTPAADVSGGRAEVIDAAGRTITPGLIDGHLHLLLGGESMTQLDLSGVRDRGAFMDAIAEWHARLPEGEWLIAFGWSCEKWPGRVLPDKSWLAPAGDRPVVCHRADLHASLVNDAVLARCDTAADVANGRIVRDDRGEPTGMMVEAAAWTLINPIIPRPDAVRKQQAVLAAQTHCHRLGLTAVGSMEYHRSLVDAYAPIRDQLTLRCRITLLDRKWPLDITLGRDFDGDETLAVIGYKAFADGTLGSRTARMLEPYLDDPGNRGTLVELAAEGRLGEWAAAVADAGLSPAIHAIGDEATRMAINAVEPLQPRVRPRIEHAQHIDSSDITRFAGHIASMQPLHKEDDGCYVRERLGERRLAGTFAFRKLRDAGACLAFGSDWPAVPVDPLAGIRAAVTGVIANGEVFLPEDNLTVEEALEAYTAGAAYALGLDEGGVLRPGAFGDLVMYDRDPFTADWRDEPPRVVMTVVAGRIVYDGR